jgi:hypothetical protein
MKKKSEKPLQEALRPEYDFRELRVVARGAKRKPPQPSNINLDPDVAEVFPDSAAVNEALRFLIRVTKKTKSKSS